MTRDMETRKPARWRALSETGPLSGSERCAYEQLCSVRRLFERELGVRSGDRVASVVERARYATLSPQLTKGMEWAFTVEVGAVSMACVFPQYLVTALQNDQDNVQNGLERLVAKIEGQLKCNPAHVAAADGITKATFRAYTQKSIRDALADKGNGPKLQQYVSPVLYQRLVTLFGEKENAPK